MDGEKTKVLYILTKSGIGGAQKYVKDLAENLDKNKFETKIICGGTDVRWLSNKTYPWFLFLNDWLAVFELIKIFKKEGPNIIHLNSSKAGVIGAMAAAIANLRPTADGRRRIKIIFTAHGWVFNSTNEISWLSRQFYVLLHKISSKFQNKIICVSEYDYNLATEYDICPPEKLAMIHNGIDANMKFLSKKEAQKGIMENIKFENPPSPKLPRAQWVGSIGRLVKEKNYETFIKAAKLVPNAYFFIIGEGPEKKNLESRIHNLGLKNRFFIIPPSHKASDKQCPPNGNDAQCLRAFDVFVMSSIKEGLPYILLEAMAAELPIVITEAGGMPELIQNHENGLMVAQKNPEALARAIGGLIENKTIAEELAKKAGQVVRNNFNLTKMVSKTEKEYMFCPI